MAIDFGFAQAPITFDVVFHLLKLTIDLIHELSCVLLFTFFLLTFHFLWNDQNVSLTFYSTEDLGGECKEFNGNFVCVAVSKFVNYFMQFS